MRYKELELVYKWRNDQRVREYMFNSDEISKVDHKVWFENSTSDPNRYLLLVCRDDKPFGFAQFKISACKTVAEWGFYVDPDGRKGQGAILGHYVLKYGFEEIGLRRIYAEVLGSNGRSLSLHTRLGFTCEGILRKHYEKDGIHQNVSMFGLLSSEWQSSNFSYSSRELKQ